jgi:competence protein ComFC
MAIVKINPIAIAGHWKSGVALDLHTISSTPIGYNDFGYMQFETVRSEIAELLFLLKNRADRSAAGPIIETAADFLGRHRDKFDLIVPVPPSQQRSVQPVVIMAEGIGQALGVPVLSCVTTTRSTGQLKNITDPDERKEHLEGLYAVDAAQTIGRKILLFDDLFRSGATLNAMTDILLDVGKAQVVRALTITKTRSNQ